MKVQRFSALVFLAAVFGAPNITAEELQLPLMQQGKASVSKPNKGDSKAAVEQRYGEPLNKTAAVGTPPISRWQYADFVVYFEYDHVVHAVAIHKPKSSDEVIVLPAETDPKSDTDSTR